MKIIYKIIRVKFHLSLNQQEVIFEETEFTFDKYEDAENKIKHLLSIENTNFHIYYQINKLYGHE